MVATLADNTEKAIENKCTNKKMVKIQSSTNENWTQTAAKRHKAEEETDEKTKKPTDILACLISKSHQIE